MHDRAAAGAAERRLVTVLFVDAQGSTELTERIGDEEMYRIMQGCVTRMIEIVEAHDGTVTQFRGDGIMALFGAPTALEHAAVNAVTAALEIRAALADQAHAIQERTGATCAFRIGVNTGPVVVGAVGDSTLVDYTAIGDTANVAARLEQAADAGEVLVSEATWRSVRDYVDCAEADPIVAKGKAEPVAVYRALKRRDVSERLDAVAARGLSPFVGRSDELTLLLGHVERLNHGHGQVVLVSGEAGIGKSRLLRELRGRLDPGVPVFEGRSSSADRDAPWHVVIDLLRRTFGVEEDDTRHDIARRVDERSAGWSEQARPSAAYVKWLLGVPVPEIDSLDPQVRRPGLFEALVTVLRDAATRRPVVMILEDIHWADEASEAALEAMAQAVADVPVLLVATFRPERVPDVGDRPWFNRIALDGLADDTAERLAAASVGAELSNGARRFVVERAEGNPLFVEELTASLLEAGVFEVRDGVIDLTVDPDTVDVPESLQDVVLARIGRLEHDARGALQLASVIGREFTRRILDRIAEMPDQLDTHLAELENLELIRQRSWFPELAYLFKHAVVHDVTYSTLLDERRRALHRLVATATEELYGESLSDHCEALARHWLAADQPDRALPHLVEAAGRAMAGLSVERAIELFGRASALAEELGEFAVGAHSAMGQAEAFMVWGRVPEAIAATERSVELAERSGDVDALARMMAQRAFVAVVAHDFDRALELSRAAEAVAQPLAEHGNTSPLVRAANATILNHDLQGRVAESDEVNRRTDPFVPLAEVGARIDWDGLAALRSNWRGQWTREPAALALLDEATLIPHMLLQWATGIHAASLGAFTLALDRLEAGLDYGARAGEFVYTSRILNTIGWIRGDLHDVAGAIDFNERSIAKITPLGLPDRECEANSRLNLAELALVLGDAAEAADQLAEIEPVIRRPVPTDRWMRWRFMQRWLCVSGDLALVRDEPGAALTLADECLPLSTETAAPKYECRARALRGRALHALGRIDEAHTDLRNAVDHSRRLATPPLLWRTLTQAAECGLDDTAGLARDAVSVIDKVVTDLGDHPLATTMRASPERARAATLAG